MQRIAAPVEKEALLRVDGKRAAAEARAHAVQTDVAIDERDLGGVEIRVLAAVPAVRFGDDRLPLRLLRGQIGMGDFPVLAVAQHIVQRLAGLGVRQVDVRGHACVIALHHRRHGDARPAVIRQVEVGFGHGDEIHVAVEAAVEREVRHLRIDRLLGAVVHAEGEEHVAARAGGVGDVRAPGRIAAVVMGDVRAVHIQISGGIGAVDFQKEPLVLRNLLAGEGLHIPAQAAGIVIAAVLSVDGVPCVGEVDVTGRAGHRLGDVLAAHDERPFAVEVYGFAHGESPFR